MKKLLLSVLFLPAFLGVLYFLFAEQDRATLGSLFVVGILTSIQIVFLVVAPVIYYVVTGNKKRNSLTKNKEQKKLSR